MRPDRDRARHVFPVPLGPSARRSRVARSTHILGQFQYLHLVELRDAAAKSKLSRLLATGNLAALIRRSTLRRSRSIISFRKAGTGIRRDRRLRWRIAGPASGTRALEGRQLKRLEIVGKQDLRCFGAHAASPASDDRAHTAADVFSTVALGRYG